MLFMTFQFALFAAAVWLALRALPRRAWNPLLLGASLVFYTLWIPAYLPLLLADIAVNYAFVRGIARSDRGSARRRWLLAGSVSFTLALLFWFKYAAFALENALPLLRWVAVDFPIPEILLPLGISFYSFQIISLSVDTYDDDGPTIDRLLEYALYISFFPQLIAGPILRGRELLPQIAAGAEPTPARARRGVWLIALGLVKKVVLADFLLAPFADRVFESAGIANAPFHWVALWGFSFQVYFDFSGYTDMARGIALLIGFELPENFREPFLSRSPQEFWQRWHITLSRWLRLYLFTPISHTLMRRGGPRWDGPAIPAALLATMAACGLWHGAGWNFVVWGVLQGILLVVWRAPRRAVDPDAVRLADVPHILLFYNVFCLTLVFFRCPDLETAARFFEGLFLGSDLPGWPRLATAVVFGSALFHVAERWARPRAAVWQQWCAARTAAPYLEASALGLLVGVVIMAAGTGAEFIYFQF